MAEFSSLGNKIHVESFVLSHLNNGLTSIKFFREKTLKRTVELRRYQPKRFGKSNYSQDSRIRRKIV